MLKSVAVQAALITITCFGATAADFQRGTSAYTIGPSVQPMVIIGEGWTQQFVFVNLSHYSAEPTVGTLSFFTKDGQPWKVPLKGKGSVDHVDLNIKPGQMVMLETDVLFSAQNLGWAYFDLSDNTHEWGIYHAYTVYRKQANGRPDLMTSVPFVDGLEDEWIVPFDNEGGKYPGVAMVNSSRTSRTTFIFDVYDLDGNQLKMFSKTLSPRSLSWFSLIDEHPDLAGKRGQIKVSGGFASSAVLTLQFAGNGAFTALPAVHTYGMR
jgi:hypothetical protein